MRPKPRARRDCYDDRGLRADARCRSFRLFVIVMGLTVAIGAMRSSHSSRSNDRTTDNNVRTVEPVPASKLCKARGLMPACAASVFWSMFPSNLMRFSCSPSSTSSSANVYALMARRSYTTDSTEQLLKLRVSRNAQNCAAYRHIRP